MINGCENCRNQETCPDKDEVYWIECPMFISEVEDGN